MLRYHRPPSPVTSSTSSLSTTTTTSSFLRFSLPVNIHTSLTYSPRIKTPLSLSFYSTEKPKKYKFVESSKYPPHVEKPYQNQQQQRQQQFQNNKTQKNNLKQNQNQNQNQNQQEILQKQKDLQDIKNEKDEAVLYLIQKPWFMNILSIISIVVFFSMISTGYMNATDPFNTEANPAWQRYVSGSLFAVLGTSMLAGAMFYCSRYVLEVTKKSNNRIRLVSGRFPFGSNSYDVPVRQIRSADYRALTGERQGSYAYVRLRGRLFNYLLDLREKPGVVDKDGLLNILRQGK